MGFGLSDLLHRLFTPCIGLCLGHLCRLETVMGNDPRGEQFLGLLPLLEGLPLQCTAFSRTRPGHLNRGTPLGNQVPYTSPLKGQSGLGLLDLRAPPLEERLRLR